MRNSDLLEQLQQKDVTYVYNLSGHNVLNSLINLKQLTFEVTDACNLKCKYCGYGDFYETHGKREDKFLQFDVAKRLIIFMIYGLIIRQLPLLIRLYSDSMVENHS